MNYISCDVETTGTDGMKHDLLEVAMAAFTSKSEKPEPFATWSTIVKKKDRVWEDATLLFHLQNGKLDYFLNSDGIKEEHVARVMREWVAALNLTVVPPWYVPDKRQYPNVCGKNFAGFDGLFLRRLPGWETLFDFRVIDLGNLVIQRNDAKIPKLQDALARVNIHDVVPHTALDDAILTGRAVWYALNGTQA